MVVGKHTCSWLKLSKKEFCGKSCVGVYCKQHNYRIRRGGKITVPCFMCGVGVYSAYQICGPCGQDAFRLRCKRGNQKALEILEAARQN